MIEPKTMVVNIRNFPRDLWWQIKSLASKKQMTILELMVWAFTQILQEQNKNEKDI